MDQVTGHSTLQMFVMFFPFLSFSLDGKRNKKIKEKRMAPPVFPANAHEQYDALNISFVFVMSG